MGNGCENYTDTQTPIFQDFFDAEFQQWNLINRCQRVATQQDTSEAKVTARSLGKEEYVRERVVKENHF